MGLWVLKEFSTSVTVDAKIKVVFLGQEAKRAFWGLLIAVRAEKNSHEFFNTSA